MASPGNQAANGENKLDRTYEFRMVIKKGLESDPDVIQLMKQFASQLSVDVFQGNSVDIHLCDENLKTLRVVVNLY